MEAKDTIKLCGDKYCQPYCHNAQVEISFKAGIREVVEWINENVFEIDDGQVIGFLQSTQYFKKDWQVKLKEWGIDTNSAT